MRFLDRLFRGRDRGSVSVTSVLSGDAPADALNAFSMRLLAAMPPADAVAISPCNVASALTLLALGARGQTLTELQEVLGFGADPEGLQRFAKRLHSVPAQARPDIVETGSALWPDQRVPLLDSYVAAARALFEAELSRVDLSDRAAVVARVNRWVSDQTHGHIDAIIGPADVPQPPGFLLSTAFYFRGIWTDAFHPRMTARAPFHSPGGDVAVDLMMRQLSTWYSQSRSMQVIDLPYKGGCGLLVVLPTAGRSLRQALVELSHPGAVDRLFAEMDFRMCRLWLPRLAIDSGVVDLSEHLRALGAASMFTPLADFGGVTAVPPTWVNAVVHRATLKVDEQGTVAAAATAVAAVGASLVKPERPVEMRVDRPFLMLIRLRRTGEILFCATVTTPPAAK